MKKTSSIISGDEVVFIYIYARSHLEGLTPRAYILFSHTHSLKNSQGALIVTSVAPSEEINTSRHTIHSKKKQLCTKYHVPVFVCLSKIVAKYEYTRENCGNGGKQNKQKKGPINNNRKTG